MFDDDPPDNPFKSFTKEHKIYSTICKVIHYYQTHDPGPTVDNIIYPNDLNLPRQTANSKFVKRLINKFEFNFSVSAFEEALADYLPSPKGQDLYSRFDNFFEKSIPALEIYHYEYLNNFLKEPSIRNSTEAIKSILLAEASVERSQSTPLTQKQLMINVNDRLLMIPRVLTNQQMYKDYLDHLPKKVIKTKTTIKKTTNFITQLQPTFKSSPWTSPIKANDYMRRNKWTDNEIEDWKWNKKSDYFDYKKQSKDYMLKTVAPRHSLIIDYFFPGKFVYLLAININTRKAFAIPSTEIKEINENRFAISEKNNKTATTAIKLLNELLLQTKIKHILCDQEAAFMSQMFKNECRKHGIELLQYIKNDVKGVIQTTDASRGNHSTLSIIDRLSRTIRRMNFNIGNDANISPNTMEILIQEYNNSPHKTLSDIVGRPITPNMVDDNERLEDYIVWTRMRDNIKTKFKDDFDIVGRNVRCLNESSKFDKVKTKLLPGIWQVVGTDSGLFICMQGDNKIKLPRWMIKLI